MKNKNSQIKAVELHLRRYGKITSMQAFEKFGATRLSSIIFVLRHKGMNITNTTIKGKNRFGNTTRYVEYHYEDWKKK